MLALLRLRVWLALALPLASGCAGAGAFCARKGFSTFSAEFRCVTPQGEVELADGRIVKLAGIRMRPVQDTQEPELLDVVNDIIRHNTSRIRVQLDQASETGVVFYKQSVYYFNKYIPCQAIRSWVVPTTTGSVNELLLVMAAGKYDPELGTMTEEARQAVALAAEKEALARWNRWRYRPLNEYRDGRAGQLYTDQDQYRARIAKGDVADHDRQMAECRENVERLGRLDVTVGPDHAATPPTDQIDAFAQALRNDNVFVRRYAARMLGELGPIGRGTPAVQALIGALNDEDRHVREFAARALGAIGDRDATMALQAATNDRVKEVREAASTALNRTGG